METMLTFEVQYHGPEILYGDKFLKYLQLLLICLCIM